MVICKDCKYRKKDYTSDSSSNFDKCKFAFDYKICPVTGNQKTRCQYCAINNKNFNCKHYEKKVTLLDKLTKLIKLLSKYWRSK